MEEGGGGGGGGGRRRRRRREEEGKDLRVDVDKEYEAIQELGEGWFAKVILVEHRKTGTEVVLKAISKDSTDLKDFLREFHYSYFLSPHVNVLNTYDVAFQDAGAYYFAQELAPLGDLTSNLGENGIGESGAKRVAVQLASALEFLHSKSLVHRDLKLDNVLVFAGDFSRVKLADFGSTVKAGTQAKKDSACMMMVPYTPPEICDVFPEEFYAVETGSDVWQLGVIAYVCLTGCLPWAKADITDPKYCQFLRWHRQRGIKSQAPSHFHRFSHKLQRLLRRILEPKPEKRGDVGEVLKADTKDRWLLRSPEASWAFSERDDPCSLAYSVASSREEKNRLLATLLRHGVETTVDREAKKEWLRQWVMDSQPRSTK
ncbi:unnamed protein product [Darwinula stevensoni]|uniref:Protein kinase domain-containing protein n=1 Tax=Darwinula stevensoni TaxID=69355 RepID=A0A7R9AFQ2_9CRUS|nr:unnamed protein product [Darwinula stevensoni]CAG0903467.1 unnamed protein product [Darwinula stevensoni]